MELKIRFIENKLTDGSKTYDIKLGNVTFACVSYEAALKVEEQLDDLINNLNLVCDVSEEGI